MPTDPPTRRRPALAGSALGWVLIAAWVGWWAASIRRDRLVGGDRTWVPPLAFLAGDFRVHVEPVARSVALGIDPYRRTDHWAFALYPYPPMVARPFAWVRWVSPEAAARIWQAGLAGCLVAGAVAAWRARLALGLGSVPASLVVAATLYSTPAVFAMERGQTDPLVLVPLLVAAGLLARRAAAADVAAGAVLGLAAWLKYYPGLMVVVPLALGRRWAVAAFVVAVVLVGAWDRDGFVRSVENGRATGRVMADKVRHVHPTKHSLVENWPMLGFVHRSHALRAVPGAVAAGVLLVPAVGLVAWRLARCPRPEPLIAPALMWMVAAATFAMPYSLDYNLVPLPLALLAVASRRDPRWVLAAYALSAAYWQPIHLPVRGPALLFVKLACLYAVGAGLCRRAGELDAGDRGQIGSPGGPAAGMLDGGGALPAPGLDL